MLGRLPSFVQFVDDVAERLQGKQCVICLVGAGFDSGFVVNCVMAHFSLRDLYPYLVECLPGAPPATVLSETLGVDVDAMLSGARTDDVDGGVVFLASFDTLPSAEQAAWISVVDRWGRRQQMARSAGERLLPSLLLVTSGRSLATLPSDQLQVSVLATIGVISQMELGLAVRLARESSDDWVTATWRENVVPAVAGADIATAEACWDACLGTMGGIFATCRDVAASREWIATDLEAALAALDAPRSANTATIAQLSAPLRAAWMLGAVTFTPEHGFELSTIASAQRDRLVDVERRVWRGQARLVLPLVDRIRFELCRALDERLPAGWQFKPAPKDDEEEEEVRRDPLTCQPGHLARILSRPLPLGGRQHDTYKRVARQCRTVRNTIAHYRPIVFAEFRDLLVAAMEAGLQIGVQSVG